MFRRGEHCMQQHLCEHFCSHDHNGFLEDVTITLTNKTKGKEPKNKENWDENFENASTG